MSQVCCSQSRRTENVTERRHKSQSHVTSHHNDDVAWFTVWVRDIIQCILFTVLNGDFFAKRYICDKFLWDVGQFAKNVQSHNVEEYLETFLDPDPDEDDLQTLISISLSIWHISGKIFTNNRSPVFTQHWLLTNRQKQPNIQTDRQTNYWDIISFTEVNMQQYAIHQLGQQEITTSTAGQLLAKL